MTLFALDFAGLGATAWRFRFDVLIIGRGRLGR